MSIRKLPDRVLKTTVNVYELLNVKNEIGETNTYHSLLYSGVKANIQEGSELVQSMNGMMVRSSLVLESEDGTQHIQSHMMFCNKFDGDEERVIKGGHVIVDTDKLRKYFVIKQSDRENMSQDVGESGFISLILERNADITDESEIIEFGITTSTASISA